MLIGMYIDIYYEQEKSLHKIIPTKNSIMIMFAINSMYNY
jgi:hypothetical protein